MILQAQSLSKFTQPLSTFSGETEKVTEVRSHSAKDKCQLQVGRNAL